MTENLNLNLIKSLVEAAKQDWDPRTQQLPQVVVDEMTLHPSLVIDAINYFFNLDDKPNQDTLNLLASIISEGFYQIRYGLDRGDHSSQLLLEKIQPLVQSTYKGLSTHKQMLLANSLYESKIPINFSVDEHDTKTTPKDFVVPDIIPRLPELLEKLRREHGFSNPYELYDLLLTQLQLESIEVQISVIYELALSKKSIVHEVAILMLLHPKPTVRKHIVELFIHLAPQKIFLPIDLRRMICIRNWFPKPELSGLDSLIKSIKKNGIMPAHYQPAQILKLVASPMDGAGCQLIMLEAKVKNKRCIAGFVLKLGVGIKEPFTHKKTTKGEFELNLERNINITHKPVSQTYLTKLVSHFLPISNKTGNIPEPGFLRIRELFGKVDWLPQPLNIDAEIKRIKEKTHLNTNEAELVSQSLARSGSWHKHEKFTESWFESGEQTANAFLKSLDEHDALLEAGSPHVGLEDLSTYSIMGPILDKWKHIFLMMLLWHRSKSIQGDYWKDFLIILELLESGKNIIEIPLLKNIAIASGAHFTHRSFRSMEKHLP